MIELYCFVVLKSVRSTSLVCGLLWCDVCLFSWYWIAFWRMSYFDLVLSGVSDPSLDVVGLYILM